MKHLPAILLYLLLVVIFMLALSCNSSKTVVEEEIDEISWIQQEIQRRHTLHVDTTEVRKWKEVKINE